MNEGNRQMVAKILHTCRESLAVEEVKSWGEVINLGMQKLLHVSFYEEITGKTHNMG